MFEFDTESLFSHPHRDLHTQRELSWLFLFSVNWNHISRGDPLFPSVNDHVDAASTWRLHCTRNS